MRNFIYILSLLVSGLLVTGCERNPEADLSEITYYVVIELEGEAAMGWQVGTPFVDPGYSATLDGTDFTSQITVESDLDSSVPGFYTITYTGVNKDGYVTQKTRNVVVYDKSQVSQQDISGNYANSVKRTTQPAGTVVSRGPYNYPITRVDAGLYYCPDFIGGYYWLGAGYGSGYAFSGYFMHKSDNTLEIVSTNTSAWGSHAVFYKTSTYDPATKQLFFYTKMSDADQFEFDVTSKFVE